MTAGSSARTGAAPGRVIDPRGRSKAYRPLPAAEREIAIERGLSAYARGAFYLAHEELEPAWMGTDDPGDRELLGGLIKLAAAFVHAARGNAAGVRTNLRGARARLALAEEAHADRGLDLDSLLAAIDDRLARLDAPGSGDDHATAGEKPGGGPPADPPHDVAGPPGRAHRPPLGIEPPILARRIAAR